MDNSSIVSVDKLVQMHVMGWVDYDPHFSPTTNANHMLEVESKLYSMGYQVLVRRCMGKHEYLLNGYAREGDIFCNVIDSKNDKMFKTVASTIPRAVCFSALKAMGVDIVHGK